MSLSLPALCLLFVSSASSALSAVRATMRARHVCGVQRDRRRARVQACVLTCTLAAHAPRAWSAAAVVRVPGGAAQDRERAGRDLPRGRHCHRPCPSPCAAAPQPVAIAVELRAGHWRFVFADVWSVWGLLWLGGRQRRGENGGRGEHWAVYCVQRRGYVSENAAQGQPDACRPASGQHSSPTRSFSLSPPAAACRLRHARPYARPSLVVAITVGPSLRQTCRLGNWSLGASTLLAGTCHAHTC